MSTTEIRKEARESLKNNWGKGVCIVLAFYLVAFIIGVIEGLVEEGTILYSIIDLVYTIVSIPLSFGLLISFIKLKRNEDVQPFGFLKDGFSRFGKSWGIWWHTFIRILLPIVCLFLSLALMISLIISSTISEVTSSLIIASVVLVLYILTLIYTVSRSLLYILAYNISYDNPGLSSKECVLKSAELMKGNRGTYFLLELSFIGWAILTVLTFGFGILWLVPYMQVAYVIFYEKVAKFKGPKVEELENIER